jgi:hypothetical protein
MRIDGVAGIAALSPAAIGCPGAARAINGDDARREGDYIGPRYPLPPPAPSPATPASVEWSPCPAAAPLP